jgi:hypothetical protein
MFFYGHDLHVLVNERGETSKLVVHCYSAGMASQPLLMLTTNVTGVSPWAYDSRHFEMFSGQRYMSSDSISLSGNVLTSSTLVQFSLDSLHESSTMLRSVWKICDANSASPLTLMHTEHDDRDITMSIVSSWGVSALHIAQSVHNGIVSERLELVRYHCRSDSSIHRSVHSLPLPSSLSDLDNVVQIDINDCLGVVALLTRNITEESVLHCVPYA